MKSTRSRILAVHDDSDDNGVPQNYTFNGQVYGSYEDAVKAKRQHNTAQLEPAQEARDAIRTGVPQPTMAPVQKEQRDGSSSSSSQPAAAAELREQPKRRCKKPPTSTSPVPPAAAGYYNGGEMLSSDSEDEYGDECEDASTNPPTRYKTAEGEESDDDDEITSKPKRKVSQLKKEASRQNIQNAETYKNMMAKKELGFQDAQLIATFASNENFKCVQWIQKETPSGEKLWTLGLAKPDKILSKMEEFQKVDKKAYADLPREKQLRAILHRGLGFHVINESSSPDGTKWKLQVFHRDVQKESDGSVDMEKIGRVTGTLAKTVKTVNPFAKPEEKKVRVSLSVLPRFNGFYLGMFPKDEKEATRARAREIIVDNYSASDTELFQKLRAAGVTERFSKEEKEAQKRQAESRIAVPRQNVRVCVDGPRPMGGNFHLGYFPRDEVEETKKKALKILKDNIGATKKQLTKLLVDADLKKITRKQKRKNRNEEGSTGKAKRVKTKK